MVKFGYVYLTTNLINGKTYVGQHHAGFFDTRYKGSGKIITQSLKKHGRKNFKVELLEWCDNQESLDNKEIEYIAKYRAKGKAEYNITDGGSGTRGLFGEKNHFYGKKHTALTRMKISRTNKGKKGPLSPLYGRKMTPEHIAKTRRTGSTQSKETREKISQKLIQEWECEYCGLRLNG